MHPLQQAAKDAQLTKEELAAAHAVQKQALQEVLAKHAPESVYYARLKPNEQAWIDDRARYYGVTLTPEARELLAGALFREANVAAQRIVEAGLVDDIVVADALLGEVRQPIMMAAPEEPASEIAEERVGQFANVVEAWDAIVDLYHAGKVSWVVHVPRDAYENEPVERQYHRVPGDVIGPRLANEIGWGGWAPVPVVKGWPQMTLMLADKKGPVELFIDHQDGDIAKVVPVSDVEAAITPKPQLPRARACLESIGLAGMHDVAGSSAQQLTVQALIIFDYGQGMIPEMAFSEQSLAAAGMIRSNHPDTVFAIGVTQESQAVQAAASMPDILVSDVVLSRQTIEDIKRQHPSVLIITRAENKEQALEGIDSGAHGVKVKPASVLLDDPSLVAAARQKGILLVAAKGVNADNLGSFLKEEGVSVGRGVNSKEPAALRSEIAELRRDRIVATLKTKAPVPAADVPLRDDLRLRAASFREHLLDVLHKEEGKSFFIGIENTIGGEFYQDDVTVLSKAIEEIDEMKDKDGKKAFPNLVVRRGSASQLVAAVQGLQRDSGLKLDHTFIAARYESVDKKKAYASVAGARIAAIDDASPGSYLPVPEAIMLNMMAYLECDFEVIKELYSAIAISVDDASLRAMIRDRILYILPKTTKFNTDKDRRDFYDRVADIYRMA